MVSPTLQIVVAPSLFAGRVEIRVNKRPWGFALLEDDACYIYRYGVMDAIDFVEDVSRVAGWVRQHALIGGVKK